MQKTVIQGNIKQIGNYILEQELGEGQFGSVYKALDKSTNTYFAIKKIEKKKINSNPILPRLLNTEIKIMKEIEHPNILHLYDYLESKTNYYLVLNFCNQGDMEHYMKTRKLKYFDEEEAVAILKMIFNGFYELRKKKVLHRDFKLANIFMSDDVLVIGDFGLSKQGDEMGRTMAGTPQTMAPELIMVDPNGSIIYDSKADIWSIGVVYYQLLFGEPPYSGNTIPEMIVSMRQRTGDKLVFFRNISEESKDILRRMLAIDPKNRINWAELFNHKLFDKKAAVKPTISGADKNFAKSFAHVKDKQRLDIQNQFNNNKNKLDAIDNVSLISVNNVGNTELLAPKQIQEQAVDPAMEFQILNDMAMEEITYTYNHERNKILFMIFSVKHLQWALTNPKFVYYGHPFFQLSLLILKKAKVLNDGLIVNLNNRNNIFDLSENFWQQYIKQGHVDSTRMLFIKLSSQLQEYINVLTDRALINGFDPTVHQAFIDAPNPNLELVDLAMTEEKNRIVAMRQNDPNVLSDPTVKSRLLSLDKLIEFSINSEQNMRYIKPIQGVYEKFKMEQFYKSITQELGVPFY